MRKSGAAGRGGMALVITLVFVALITIVVVAMSASVLLDRPAAKSHFEKVRAMQLAHAGVDQVVAVLRQNIGQTNRDWISGPGQLVVAATTNNILSTTNLLYSGTATTSLSGVFQSQALNLATFQDPSTYLITSLPDGTGNIPALPVAWVYLRRDGTQDFSTTPVTNNASNPIVGRYEYWTDDESSKVNLNLAWSRGATNASASYGSPTKVDLTALTNMTSSDADMIHNYLTTNGYGTLPNDLFNSPKDARRVGSPVSTVLATNQFFTTFYNHDPDMSCFSLPRIVLTTQKSLAGGRPFLDILTTENTDPGDANGISNTNLNNTLFGVGGTAKTPVYPGLVWYMSRTDWPMAPGSSFLKKYGVSSTDYVTVTQMAMDIIDYVRSKESTQQVVVPIRGALQNTSTTGTNAIGSGASFLGRTRTPLITEVGMWIGSPATVKGNPPRYFFPAEAVIEVYLPPAYGLTSYNLTNAAELIQYYNGENTFQPAAISGSISPTNCAPSSILGAGQYVTITNSFLMDWINATNAAGQTVAAPSRPSSLPVRAGISIGTIGTTNILNVVPLSSTQANMLQVPINATGVAVTAITSMEANDPCVTLLASDWSTNTSGGNTFGAVNSRSTLHQTQSNPQPQQDTDTFGQLTDASMVMPPPKSQVYTNVLTSAVDDNTAGVISSVGELGYIHTGISSPGNEMPWRTLRLQPNNTTTNTVPDWALLDIFTVPSLAVTACTNAGYVIMPHNTSIGGRININASASSAPFSLNRVTPLAAAFSGCFVSQTNSTTLSATQAQTVAQNIYADVLSPSNFGNTGKQYGSVPFYYTPGQIAEISGVSDQGESSEQLVRQAINQLTTRGDVFTVYSVGQSLQQAASGTLLVTGEERLQAVVERYLDATVTPAAIRFRILYFQRLTP